MGTKGASYDALGMAIGLSHYAKVLCVVSTNNDILDLWENESSTNTNFSLLKIKVANTILSGVFGLLNIQRFIRIKKRIDTFSPNFVYSFMGHPWERAFVPYLKCKNVLCSIHDAEPDHGDKDWRRPFMNLFNYNPKWYVAYSQNTKDGLINRGYNKDNIIVTHLACSMMSVKQAPLRVNLQRNNKFLFWGRIEPYKGLSILLEAAEQVFKNNHQAKLVIAGRGNMNGYLDKLNGLGQNVEIHNDWIPNEKIGEYFDIVDFVVLPYTAASQSGVITLAYSFGKPVIVSDSGALPEQVKCGVSGIVVPTGNVTKLANAISFLLNNDEILSKMKQGAFDYSKELTFDVSAKKILDFLSEKNIF